MYFVPALRARASSSYGFALAQTQPSPAIQHRSWQYTLEPNQPTKPSRAAQLSCNHGNTTDKSNTETAQQSDKQQRQPNLLVCPLLLGEALLDITQSVELTVRNCQPILLLDEFVVLLFVPPLHFATLLL